MKKKGNGWFLVAVIIIAIVLVAGTCISGTQKSRLTIDKFQIDDNKIAPGGAINFEINVVNHEDRVLDPNTNKFGVCVGRVVLDTADDEWLWVEDDKYWNNLPQSKWIDEEIGADVPHSIPFTAAISENTIPRGTYKFQACIFDEAKKFVDWSAIRTVTVT